MSNILIRAIFIILVATLAVCSVHAGEIDAVAVVAAHNKWRMHVGVTKKLRYSPSLATSAQTWVDKLKRTNHCRMRHSKPNGQYGENLYWASALRWSDGRRELQEVTAQKVVDSWGSEKADYDYVHNHCATGKMCGHYTQIVWRTTTTVGCAMVVCEDSNEQVWACQYRPAGNWVGRKPY